MEVQVIQVRIYLIVVVLSHVVSQLGYKVDGTTDTLEEQFKSAGLNVQEINKDNISEWQVRRCCIYDTF